MTNSNRRTIKIPSKGEELDAWVYPAAGVQEGQKAPAILMAHGLGGIKLMRLDAFSEKFSQAGFVTIAFDYRFFGDSSGEPRGLIDITKQQEDWDSAFDYVRTQMLEVDPDRIGLFGTSFSGGHVIQQAAKHGNQVKATVSQCPFTDGLASALQVKLSTIPTLFFRGIRDQVFRSNTNPVRIPLVAEPGNAALLASHDTVSGYMALLPPGVTKLDVEEVPARAALWIPLARPGTYAKQVQSPIFFAVCTKDSVAPAKQTIGFAKQAPKGTIKEYDVGHFDIYVGEPFEKATKDYIDFYKASFDAAITSKL
jgi:uncharacterized protein